MQATQEAIARIWSVFTAQPDFGDDDEGNIVVGDFTVFYCIGGAETIYVQYGPDETPVLKHRFCYRTKNELINEVYDEKLLLAALLVI